MTARVLMCAPDHFDVAYVINPWMKGNVARCDPLLAMRQWQALDRAVGRVAIVETVRAGAGVPDMVFTANAGLVLAGKVVPAQFRHVERQPEQALFARWFEAHGYRLLRLPADICFEGAGDALFDRGQPLLWLGHGHRSDERAAPLLAALLGVEVQPLRLVDPRFYHLDTCFCPLEGGELLYYPAAFDGDSRHEIERRIPAGQRIEVSETDAAAFACNAVSIDREIFMNHASPDLLQTLAQRNYHVHLLPLSEFMKAGGAAKCLTLRLDENLPGTHQKPLPPGAGQICKTPSACV